MLSFTVFFFFCEKLLLFSTSFKLQILYLFSDLILIVFFSVFPFLTVSNCNQIKKNTYDYSKEQMKDVKF